MRGFPKIGGLPLRAAAWLLMALVIAAPAAEAQTADDHPLVTGYPGSELAAKDVQDFERYKLVTGLADQDFESVEIEGTLTRLRYQSPADRSVEEIFANYEQALIAAGMTEIWRCADIECGPALAAMAEILGKRPDLSVWVVGHTDWTGEFDLNMRLSDDRAKTVVAALTERFGIAADRVSGYGVGPLAPAASNSNDPGRTANRRVELVARP